MTGFLIRRRYCLVILFGMLIGWQYKPRFSGLVYLASYAFYMLRRNGLAKKYNTERFNILLQIPRIFKHIYIKWSILIIQYNSTLNLHLLHMNIYNCIWICIYRNTYTRWSHWFHIHIIFSSWFYSIIVTKSNSIANCKYDPSY